MLRAVEVSDPEFNAGIVRALPRLRAQIKALCRDDSFTEDILQEVAAKAIANQKSFEPGTNLDAWLYTIGKNYFLTVVRKMRREVADPEGAHSENAPQQQNQEAAVALSSVLEAINRLPHHMRKPIRLVGLMGYSYEAAAKECNVPEGTIKSQVNRARLLLAEHSDKLFGEPSREGSLVATAPVQDRSFLYALAKHYLAEHGGDIRGASDALIKRLLADRAALEEVVGAAVRSAVSDFSSGVIRKRRRVIGDRAESGRGAVVALAAGISAALLDMPMTGGAKLRNASRDLVIDEANKAAGLAKTYTHREKWLRAIAQAVPNGKSVGEVVTDQRAQELWDECK